MNSFIKLLGFSAVASTLFVGCATVKNQPSGFLGDSRVYNAMQPDSEIDDVMVFKSQPFPLAGYDSFIVPPVTVYLNEEGLERELEDEELRELAENFRKEIITNLGSRYQMVKTAAPRVAILRIAITDANPSIPLMNIHPGSLITGGGLGGASMEVDLIDSITGRRVAAIMASSKGKRYEYGSGLSKWGHTESVFQEWAKLLSERIEKSHG